MAKKQKDANQPGIDELTRELDSINRQLKDAYERFNYACEPELVDASIYEINALKAKYDYFLRCVKELTGTPRSRCYAPPAETQGVCAAGNLKGGTACHL